MAIVIADTRQHRGKHDAKHAAMASAGFEPRFSKLYVGDYQLPPSVAVDTKASIHELAQNIDQEHDRFRRELIRAREAGTKLYILVENTDGVDSLESLEKWIESDAAFRKRQHAKRRIYGARLARACSTMQRKYGATFAFCHPSETGLRILELLGVDHGE